jgi:hypothetical protein
MRSLQPTLQHPFTISTALPALCRDDSGKGCIAIRRMTSPSSCLTTTRECAREGEREREIKKVREREREKRETARTLPTVVVGLQALFVNEVPSTNRPQRRNIASLPPSPNFKHR